MKVKGGGKRPAAFVLYSFHKKTKSFSFVKELLSEEYALKEFWAESWRGGKDLSPEQLNKYDFETIFFCQYKPSALLLTRLKCKNFVWFPMYDTEEARHYSEYIPLLFFNVKVLSFSKAVYSKIKKAGLECRYYKYHVRPVSRGGKAGGIRVFFWMRTPDVDWSVARELLGGNRVEKVVLRNIPDPDLKKKPTPPSKEDIRRYNIEVNNRWLSREEYDRLLSSCNIFIAPRRAEGIGLSFIEALSRGLCVIAPDNPTMNEYIVHGRNGLLYDPSRPSMLDLSDFAGMRKRAEETALKDFKSWEGRKRKILVDVRGRARPGHGRMAYFALTYLWHTLWRSLRGTARPNPIY